MIALAMAVLMLAVNSKPAPDGLGQDRPVNKQPIGVSVQSPDVPRLRKLLAEDPSIPASCGTRVALVTALLALRAPAQELVEPAGQNFCGPNPLFYYNLAAELNGRGECLAEALQYAEWSALRYANDGIGQLDPTLLIASIRIKRGEFDWVIGRLSKSRESNSGAFAWLGFAYEKSHQVDPAIKAYIQSVGAQKVWSTIPPQASYPRFIMLPDFHLEEIYRKRYGSLDGLAAKIEAARRAAWRALYVDPFRIDHSTFQWTLMDLGLRFVSLSNYEGKIVVLCFVPTEYEPVVKELKYLQNLSEKYQDRGVIFLAVDVNQRNISWGTRRQNVGEALKKAGITLPAMMEEYDTVRKCYFMGGVGGRTAGVVIIDREHTQAFLTGGVSQEYLPRITKILDYLLEGTVGPSK
jgi:tetratricopeptide (TPR) repeat protein